MTELYKMNYSQAAESAIEQIMEDLNVSKAKATVLFKNAIIYNCVIEEIVGQAAFLLEKEGDKND